MNQVTDPRLAAVSLHPGLRRRITEMFLVRHLVRSGMLDRAAAKKAIAEGLRTGRHLARLLVQDHYVTRGQMRETLGELRRFMRF